MTRDELETLLLQFIGSLTICDHMGDVSNDIQEVLKRLGIGDIEWDEFHELGAELGRRGITTLYGTSLREDDEDLAESEATP